MCSLPSISMTVRPMTLPTSALERDENVSLSFRMARQSSYFVTTQLTRFMNSERMTGCDCRSIANMG